MVTLRSEGSALTQRGSICDFAIYSGRVDSEITDGPSTVPQTFLSLYPQPPTVPGHLLSSGNAAGPRKWAGVILMYGCSIFEDAVGDDNSSGSEGEVRCKSEEDAMEVDREFIGCGMNFRSSHLSVNA